MMKANNSGKPIIPTRPAKPKPTIIPINVTNGGKPKFVPTSLGSIMFLTIVIITYITNSPSPNQYWPIIISIRNQGINAVPTPTIGNATPNVDTFVIVEIANARVANKINSGNTANTLSKIYLKIS